ncbi:MAG: adenylosuccinate lyase [Bacteroidia bacterium]
MELNQLTAISPIDGRYRNTTQAFSDYFSESALMKYRLLVEVEYFIALCELPLEQLKSFQKNNFSALRNLVKNFSKEDAQKIKDIEKITNHDVKAIEYFLKEKFDALGFSAYKEFIHFGLTSQDINNTAIPLSLKDAMNTIVLPILQEIVSHLKKKSEEWKHIPMLAKTHGQPASPTILGKEIAVFAERIEAQLEQLNRIPYSAKFGGATGNFNAHHVTFPEINWKNFANTFVNKTLGLQRSQYTTQIEHYDNFAAFCDAMKRINTICIDLNRDVWMYISMDYFKQKIKEGEVGSSAMPHKVNPIDFENSEGNLGVANALFEHFAAKLPVSRLQRDLTDSTVLRNTGVPLAHSFIAYRSLLKGFDKLILNTSALEKDLENNWAVVAEAIQTILRREAYPNPYEALKSLTRSNTKITQESIHTFIEGLDVSEKIKLELKKISPHNYTGI